jgi:hypothetical protein
MSRKLTQSKNQVFDANKKELEESIRKFYPAEEFQEIFSIYKK